MPEHPEETKTTEHAAQRRRRNKWLLAGILAATALVLYLGIMLRIAAG